ncbi:MAG: ABA4-like family protein [Proteobacteria bacterium]|nr:ABA4-like family protein [Pseudomonadota bacterium]
MSADLIFSICSNAVLPGWLLLVLLPRWKWTLGLICTAILPLVLGMVYVGLFLSQLGNMPQSGGFGSLDSIAILFSNPYVLAAGWIHYLAFDLFVGAWEVHDSQQQGISHWLVIPCLFLTLMLGPTGLALYLIIRTVKSRRLIIYDQQISTP